MDFPHVDEKTDERFTRLWPLHAENSTLKVAAEANPKMISFARDDGGPHFRLYESRIPISVDADEKFGAFATEDAKRASLAESAEFRAGKAVGEKVEKASLDERYPEAARYYPPMGPSAADPEKSERQLFNETVKKLEAGPDVKYTAAVGAFVSKRGPIPELAEWQTPEMKARWEAEGKIVRDNERKPADRAKEVVEASAMRGKGEGFLADHAKGLLLPSTKFEKVRGEVVAEVRKASTEDLKTVQGVTETELKLLEKKQYAIQIKAAQAKNPEMTVEDFNAMKSDQRRVAAGYDEITADEFKRMVALKSGFSAITAELKDRGEHMSREEALGVKGREEKQAEAKPVDTKDKSGPKPTGRQSSKGAGVAAALADSLGRR